MLDVGCGGGAAAFALVPPATELVATDRQEDMLRLFAATAADRGISARTVPGSWPEVADRVPTVQVVVCHNGLYNATDLVDFAHALHDHAERRVVIEITERHPQVARARLWRHFLEPRPARTGGGCVLVPPAVLATRARRRGCGAAPRPSVPH